MMVDIIFTFFITVGLLLLIRSIYVISFLMDLIDVYVDLLYTDKVGHMEKNYMRIMTSILSVHGLIFNVNKLKVSDFISTKPENSDVR